jgi:hypothetical protein
MGIGHVDMEKLSWAELGLIGLFSLLSRECLWPSPPVDLLYTDTRSPALFSRLLLYGTCVHMGYIVHSAQPSSLLDGDVCQQRSSNVSREEENMCEDKIIDDDYWGGFGMLLYHRHCTWPAGRPTRTSELLISSLDSGLVTYQID